MKDYREKYDSQLADKDKIIREKLQKYADTITYHKNAITDKQAEFEEMVKKRDQTAIDEAIFNKFCSDMPDIPMVDL